MHKYVWSLAHYSLFVVRYDWHSALLEQEIDYFIGNLKKLVAPKHVPSPGLCMPAFSTITPRPKTGPACLVIGPSNYPLSLSLQPVAGSLAAGNPTVLKPSELASATSTLMHRLVTEYFDPSVFCVVLGGIPETKALLQESWGLIFFTGSGRVGKVVAEAAAKTLTPTVLELGGKSPCYVDETAPSDLKAVANRIIWAKTLNAGQTCAAVDTLIVHESIVDRLLPELVKTLEIQFGPEPAQGELGRMVTSQHAARHVEMIQEAEMAALSSSTGTSNAAEETNRGCKIICGGSKECDARSGYVCPTIVVNPPRDCRLLKEEIFGPILPVITVKSREEAIQVIRDLPGTPLCLYVFTKSSRVFDEITQKCPSGSTMRNDALVHLTSPFFAFGGLGSSGYGGYHGKHSFETFSHQHMSMYRPCLPGMDFFMARYHPFGNIKGVILEKVLFKVPATPVLHVRAWTLVTMVALACRYVPPLQNLTKVVMTVMAGMLETMASFLRESSST
jgi:acyl-CoA reductase-like NAD-dependent aldehyde dehydrogenase